MTAVGSLFTHGQAGEELSNSSSFPTAGRESAAKADLASSLSPPELSDICQVIPFFLVAQRVFKVFSVCVYHG